MTCENCILLDGSGCKCLMIFRLTVPYSCKLNIFLFLPSSICTTSSLCMHNELVNMYIQVKAHRHVRERDLNDANYPALYALDVEKLF